MSQERARPSIILRSGRLIDGMSSTPVERASVLVSGERIAAVGDEADRQARLLPPGSLLEFDATGRTILPGLIDAHCHIGFGDATHRENFYFYTSPESAALRAAFLARRVLRAGITTICDPIGVHGIGPALRDAIESGMAEGPRMMTAGRALTTRPGLGFPNRLYPEEGLAALFAVDGPDAAVAEIRRQANDGVDLIKILGTGELPAPGRRGTGEHPLLSLEELRAIVAAAHRLGLKTAMHARPAAAVADAAKAGIDWVYHASFMGEPEIELCLAHGTALCPTLTFLANAAEFGGAAGISDGFRDACRRELDAASENLARAYRAGVPMMCGTDSGLGLVPQGEWHAREIELFVTRLGLAPVAAISCATSTAARVLGLADDIGAVSPGKLADILVIDGDPVADIRVLQDHSRFALLMKSGQIIDRKKEPERRELRHESVRSIAARPLRRAHTLSTQNTKQEVS